MCVSVPMMFDLIPFEWSQMVLLAEVRAKQINFDYMSLTSFDYCKKSLSDLFSYKKSSFLPLVSHLSLFITQYFQIK